MHVVSAVASGASGALQARISVEQEISALLREHLDDLRKSRDAWRTHAEAARLVLIGGKPRAGSSAIGKVHALFKRWLLLSCLAAVLLIPSNLIPVSQENIEATLRCVLSPFQQLAIPSERRGTSKLSFVGPYTSEDRDYLIRTIAFEASGESEEGKAAVAHVILTRKRSGRWGNSIKDVVTHPGQFESWMTKRAEMEALDVEDYRYRSAAQIADAVLAGRMPDPTTGATHFLNPVIVQQRRGGSLPAWASAGGLSIGRHTFYAPDAVAVVATVTQPSMISCWPSLLRNSPVR
jgi:hypothetical protein